MIRRKEIDIILFLSNPAFHCDMINEANIIQNPAQNILMRDGASVHRFT